MYVVFRFIAQLGLSSAHGPNNDAEANDEQQHYEPRQIGQHPPRRIVGEHEILMRFGLDADGPVALAAPFDAAFYHVEMDAAGPLGLKIVSRNGRTADDHEPR